MRIEIILAYSYFAITMLGLSVAIKWFNRKRFASIADGFAVTLLMLVHVLIFQVEHHFPGSIPDEVSSYYELPLGLTFVLPTLVLMHAIVTIIMVFSRYKKSITKASIREAVNEMECGLLFAEPDGTVILLNRVMATLAKTLTGREVHDGEAFWNFIISFEETNQAKRIDFSSGPSFLFANGEVWSFGRSILKDSDRRFVEIIAKNVTTLYERTEDMKKDISELELVESEMYRVLKGISETGNREELLNYKVRIHDSLGNAVLRIRKMLRNENATDEEIRKVLSIWSSTVSAYRNNRLENTSDSKSNYESLLTLAHTLGVELKIEGVFPTESALAIRAVRESMYNSIRHAYANVIFVESYKSREGYHLHIHDDGQCDSEAVNEGGGLSALRKTIEEEGGSMEIAVNEGVELNLFIREGEW